MAPPQMVQVINTASLWPVDPGKYQWRADQKHMDIEEPVFHSKDTAKEKEQEQFKKEQAELAKLGITIKDNHMDGYVYKPPVREFEREKGASGGVLRPWETEISSNHIPQCTSGNWKHTEVLFEIENSIAYITLNRVGHNNAINAGISEGLADAAAELRTRKDVRLAVLQANGRMFCAGGDPKGFQEAAAMSDAQNKASAMDFAKFLYEFQTLPQFTVACIQGSAMGGGVGFVSMCDMAIAVKEAYFVLSEVKLGVIPATISPYVVAKLGIANSTRLFCTAENISAVKAQEYGLIQEVVDSPEEFKDWIKQLAEKMTDCAPEAVHSSKKLVMNVANQPLSEALIQYTGNELGRVRKTAESADGMKAIQERRKPYWAQNPIVPKQ